MDDEPKEGGKKYVRSSTSRVQASRFGRRTFLRKIRDTIGAGIVIGMTGPVYDSSDVKIDETSPSPTKVESLLVKSDLYSVVFHDLKDSVDGLEATRASSTVSYYKRKIAQKPDFEREHLMIPRKYEKQIKEAARANGIREDTLIGVISAENGGGEDVTNQESGARGVAQFMVPAGIRYGLIKDGVDMRGDPIKSIAAAGEYLRDLKALFGDEGLAIWAYHAGEGNAAKALRVYFETLGKEADDFTGIEDPVKLQEIGARLRYLVQTYKVSVHKVMENETVYREVVSKLEDFSGTYPYQVVAASELFFENRAKFG